jgi:hypothetical protein
MSEGSINNNRLSTDLSTQIGGPGGVKKVQKGGGPSVNPENGVQERGNAASVVHSGAPLSQIAQAKLAMNKEGLAPAGNFHNSVEAAFSNASRRVSLNETRFHKDLKLALAIAARNSGVPVGQPEATDHLVKSFHDAKE